MRYPDSFIEDVRSRLPLSLVIGQKVKLKRTGGTWTGRCCFHQEKTASLNVNDARGTFKCFGCGEQGDLFAFGMKVHGWTFTEAVERYAEEAGLEVPKPDPHAVAKESRRLALVQVLGMAQAFFSEQMNPEVLTYLTNRGVSHASIKKFGLGYAPPGRSDAKSTLVQKGATLEDLSAAGIIVAGPEVPVAYDRFRDRITIPIRDHRGQLAGFGARALRAEQVPKYLNSAEGPTFDKGSILFNADMARQPAHEGKPLLVMEGYFDVIAAVQAGWEATVGTMGTAITERHLTGLWRMADVPILMFDGDNAGRKAALKAIRLALPLVYPGRSLKVAFPPAGEDPDSLLRKRGADAFRQVVNAASGLADTFWRLMVSGKVLTAVEDRASIEAEMAEAYRGVPDENLRGKYLKDLRDRVSELSRRPAVVRSNGHSHHSTSPGAIRLVHGVARDALPLRDAALLVEIIRSPAAAADAAETIAGVKNVSEHTRQVISELLFLIGSLPEHESGALMQAISQSDIQGDIEQAIGVCREAGIKSLS